MALTSLDNGSVISQDPAEFGMIFNSFFTNLSSTSTSNTFECETYVNSTFTELKKNGELFKKTDTYFSFQPTTETIVKKLILNLDAASGAGISGISSKVLKGINKTLVSPLTKIINNCILTNKIPTEWKTAVVTPLYKRKGLMTDINNYRGISVLPPIAKIFEKILAAQITIYVNINELLFKGQHGFRSNHSCETALHELLSDINKFRDKKLITMLLFIDFRKAFDLVDSKTLLTKLFHYGFDNNSLKLVTNYFSDRM